MICRTPCSTIVAGKPCCCCDSSGGGGGPCIGAQPLAFGSGRIGSSADTRYLQPPGEYTGSNLADINPIPYRVQNAATIKRLEIRIRAGAGNGGDVEYEVMRMVPPGPAGVSTPLGAPMLITLPSTFAGVASIAADNVCADGDELVLEVRKAAGIMGSPMDVQAFLQFEQDCGGGGGGGCCPPSYVGLWTWQGELFPNLIPGVGSLDFAASLCGQDEPITAVFRGAYDAGLVPAPVVSMVGYAVGPPSLLRVTYDTSGAPDGDYVLEITNACGCCTLIPVTLVGV